MIRLIISLIITFAGYYIQVMKRIWYKKIESLCDKYSVPSDYPTSSIFCFVIELKKLKRILEKNNEFYDNLIIKIKTMVFSL